jgi:hypothetical protein
MQYRSCSRSSSFVIPPPLPPLLNKMSQHIDLLGMPGLWTPTSTQLPNGLRFTLYVDPSKQFFSLSPVTTMEKLNAWYSAQCPVEARSYAPVSVKEAMRMREIAWSAETRKPGVTWELEDWHISM